MSKVAVVTDSTASLRPDLAAEHGIVVVPLQVVIGAQCYDDGVDPEASPASVAAALRDYQPVSTSRPSPAVMLEAFESLVAEGATEIVSVHLSSQVSATFESALLAAKDASVPVHVVDSRQIGAGTGYAALTAAQAAAAGATGEEAAEAARRRAAGTSSLFYVDTLEYLRRGGRMGTAAALLGSALAVKPILEIVEGRVVAKEKVRTSSRALARLEELAVLAAAAYDVDVTVGHLANEDGATALAAKLGERLADNLGGRTIEVAEVAAVLGAHVGPGVVGVVISPLGGVVHRSGTGAGDDG